MGPAIWHPGCIIQGMLRITIHESGDAVQIKLEGRVTGPWAEELNRAWREAAPDLDSKKIFINLCGVTYADESGKQVLVEIFSETDAELITGGLWTQDLAEEVTRRSLRNSKNGVMEDRNGNAA